MEKCPRCGAMVQLVVTEVLCSRCGIVDGSKIVLKKAKAICLKPRLFAVSAIFTLIISFSVLMRINPDFVKSNPGLEIALFYLIAVLGIGVNIYTSLLLKKNFPYVGFDNI